MIIQTITLKKVFDSRAEPTIEAYIITDHGEFSASLPSGKSRGSQEASVKSYEEASKTLENITATLKGKNLSSIQQCDDAMRALDDTPQKEILGGNVMLGISIACARALSAQHHLPLWKILQLEFFNNAARNNLSPRIFANLINGGAHAKNNLTIQEYLLITQPTGKIQNDIEQLITIYQRLYENLSLKERLIPIGDEGGFALDFKNNLEPLELLEHIIKKEGLEKRFALGLDIAASSFFDGTMYHFEHKKQTQNDLIGLYTNYAKKIKTLYSIEDPFAENNEEGFAALQHALPNHMIIGDDITTTNPDKIAMLATHNAIKGVIIKPNQIGTISETARAITTAHQRKLQCIVSHRSGETEDTFIIHLARAAGIYGVKIGAPTHERMIKYNELLRLYN